MAVTVNMIDVMQLRESYDRDLRVKRIMDYAASRKYNSAETTVDRLVAVFRQHGNEFSRKEIVDAFRDMELLKLGTFVIGRRGQQSRFKWNVHMTEAGKAASGLANSIHIIKEGEVLADESVASLSATANLIAPDSIRHGYNLRPGYVVEFALPSDLNVKEAARLAEFIKTLPFDDQAA